MATDNCKQTTIPQTDNTPLLCDSFIADECVIVPEGNAFLLTNDNENLKEFHEKIIEKLIEFNQSIITLENTNPELATFDFELVGTMLNFKVNDIVVNTVDLTPLTTGGLTETKETFTAAGGETSFVVSNTIATSVPNQLVVEGITMLEGIGNDYTVSGSTVTLTLAVPVQAGNIVQLFYKY